MAENGKGDAKGRRKKWEDPAGRIGRSSGEDGRIQRGGWEDAMGVGGGAVGCLGGVWGPFWGCFGGGCSPPRTQHARLMMLCPWRGGDYRTQAQQKTNFVLQNQAPVSRQEKVGGSTQHPSEGCLAVVTKIVVYISGVLFGRGGWAIR